MTTLTDLQQLEIESIEIIREAVATAQNPVMLYSISKDSSVMLHLSDLDQLSSNSWEAQNECALCL